MALELPTHIPLGNKETDGFTTLKGELLSVEDLQALGTDQISISDVAVRLGTNLNIGLNSAEAARRLVLYGNNELEKKGRTPLILLFLSQFLNLIIVILIIAAIVSIIVGDLVEGIAVITIILVTVGLSTFTEYSSGNALEALSQLTDPHTHVYRDGKLCLIRTPEVVPGDVIQLSPGDLVPADARIVEAHSAKVNEMILTGESADVAKKDKVSSNESNAKLTNVNMVYSSTSVVEGRIKCVVLLTGMNTRVGSIAALLSSAEIDKETNGVHEISDIPRVRGQLIRDISMRDYSDPHDSDDEVEIEEDDEDNVEGVEKSVRSQGVATASHSHATPSVFSRLAQFVQSYRPKQTPLQEGLQRLGLMMTTFALTGASLIVIIGISRGFRDPINDKNAYWLQSVLLGISVAVSAIPEGLPLVITICMALGTTAMAAQNALIRRLPAVETLGSASVICSDKTGTLTSGKMTVTKIWTMGNTYHVSGEGYDPTHGSVNDASGKLYSTTSGVINALHTTMQVANLCNEATVDFIDKRWKIVGSSTEASLVVSTEKYGLITLANRDNFPRILNLPFSSTLKMMATVHKLCDEMSRETFPSSDECTGDFVVLAKGAPQNIATLCKFALTDQNGARVTVMSDAIRDEITNQVDALSSTGLRVLAMCYKRVRELPVEIQQDYNDELSTESKLKLCVSDMIFCGIIGMMDPPRIGVRAAVKRAKKGSIRTVMITGDYLKTAVAIAEMVAILEPDMDEAESAVDCSVLRPHGTYLSHYEIDSITWHSFVFARAKPEDKLEIVKSFQRQGFVCAMTGDGVNDAPALRRANIGIAMGLAGSEVAKAASDMILTDDKFSSIILAVELGRTIYANLRKFIMYLIGTNWSQVLVILVAVLIGMPAPLEPLQVLFINLITDSAPAIALSIEKPESDVMKDKPRRRDELILSGLVVTGIIWHACALVFFMLLTYFMGLWWETGTVLLNHMYDGDELVEECQRLNGDGVWETIHDPNCIKDGVTIARTMVFLTIVFSECLRPLTARSFTASLQDNLFDNKPLIYAICFSLTSLFIIVFVPGVDKIFHLANPNWYEWLLVIAGVVLTIFSDERLKASIRSERVEESRWNKLFNRLKDSSRELRNIRAHFIELQQKSHEN